MEKSVVSPVKWALSTVMTLFCHAGHDGAGVVQHEFARGQVEIGRGAEFELGNAELGLERLGFAG